jgi:Ca2+-binding EF-hand superfamily protein
LASPFVQRKMALGFYRLDLDKDGVLRQDDFARLGQQIAEQLQGAQGSAQTSQIVQGFIKVWEAYGKPADKDGDNAVTFDEFAEAYAAFRKSSHAREQDVGMTTLLFAAIDTNGDGRISAQEYAAYLKPMDVSAAEAEAAFLHLDRNGDGFISADELATASWEYWNSEDRSAPGNWFFGSY